jgi:hypothetical protein
MEEVLEFGAIVGYLGPLKAYEKTLSPQGKPSSIVLRDEIGNIIFLAYIFFPWCTNPLEVELSACFEGLDLALT